MQTRTSLLGGAAFGVVLALGLTSVADAKTHKHHRGPPAADPALKSEVEELEQQVQALQAWRNQEAADRQAERQQTQQQMDQVQGRLADAEVRAQRAEAQVQTQIQTIPGEVHEEVAKAQPKPGWWANTSVSGRMYYDLSNLQEKSNVGNAGLNFGSNTSLTCPSTPCTIVPIASGNKGHSPNGFNFDVKRLYISVDHTFNSMFSADFTTDFLYDYASGATQLYIKKAYLQAKFSPMFIVRLGAADMPWIPFDEDVYGYRYVEYTLIDRTKFGTSSDWGAHVLGTMPVGPATLGYQASVVNGMGYKTPGFIGGANRSNSMDFEGRVNLNYNGFVAAVGGYSGKLGQDYSAGAPTFHTAQRVDALLAYSNKRFRIGGEYMWANADVASSQITTPVADKSDGWEVFGNINLTSQISVFGRYDWVKPRETTKPTQENAYYDFGISYEPVKIVDFALVYKHDEILNGAFADQNFATNASNGHGAYDEVGLWGQFRW